MNRVFTHPSGARPLMDFSQGSFFSGVIFLGEQIGKELHDFVIANLIETVL